MSPATQPYRFCPRCGAPLALGERFGRTRAFCRYCNFIHFTDPKVAVGALVTDGQRVLLVRRGAIPRIGYWALPAGYMDADETPEEAVAREVEEETGVQARIGPLKHVVGLGGWEERRGLLLLYSAEAPGPLGGITEPGSFLEAGDDVTEARWFGAADIPWQELAFESTEQFLREWVTANGWEVNL